MSSRSDLARTTADAVKGAGRDGGNTTTSRRGSAGQTQVSLGDASGGGGFAVLMAQSPYCCPSPPRPAGAPPRQSHAPPLQKKLSVSRSIRTGYARASACARAPLAPVKGAISSWTSLIFGRTDCLLERIGRTFQKARRYDGAERKTQPIAWRQPVGQRRRCDPASSPKGASDGRFEE